MTQAYVFVERMVPETCGRLLGNFKDTGLIFMIKGIRNV